MNELIYEQLTLFREVSRASLSARPGSEEARKMTVTSGLKCAASYTNSGPLGSLVRMLLGSSIWHSTRCYLTWKTKVTKSNRLLFQLAVSMPRTEDTGSLLWPTPSTGAALCGGTGNFKTLKRMADIGLITEDERRELSKGNGGKTDSALLEWLMGYEQQFTKLVPTPVASEYRGASKERYWMPQERERERRGKYRNRLCELVELTPLGKIGPMNPEYLEWLMGYQTGQTELKASETQ